MKVLDEAAKMFTATGTCRLNGKDGWKIKGMKSSLESYQMLGAAFMRYRETRAQVAKGGFLADAMGLGVCKMISPNISVANK